MASVQFTFSSADDQRSSDLNNISIEVKIPKFSFNISRSHISRYVSDHKTFSTSQDIDDNSYKVHLPLPELVGSDSEDIYGFFLYHFIDILRDVGININDYSFKFTIDIKDGLNQVIKSKEFEGIYYLKSPYSSDFDRRNHQEEYGKFRSTYGDITSKKTEKLNEKGLSNLPEQYNNRVFIINKEAYELFKYIFDAAHPDRNISDEFVLNFIQILVDLNGEHPEFMDADFTIGITQLRDFLKKSEYNISKEFFEYLQENFNKLFDFPIAVPEINTLSIAGDMTIISEEEVSQQDLDFYDLSVEYQHPDGTPKILKYDWLSSARTIENNKISFNFTEDEVILTNNISGPITIKVKGYDGAVLWEDKLRKTDETLQNLDITIKKYPSGTIEVDPQTGIPRSTKRLRGKVLQNGDKYNLNGLTIIVQAKKEGDEINRIVASSTTDQSGNFSLDYPYGDYTEAQAMVSLMPNSPVDLDVDQDNSNETISDDFIYLLLIDEEVQVPESESEEDDCGCHTPKKAKRLPDQEDLINSDEYTQDIGGSCINLSTPNRTLREYSYNAIVRISDPEVSNYVLEKKKERDGKISYNLEGGKKTLDRREVGLDNPIRWEDAPDAKENLSMYQAVSVATGHILHYKSVFKADGYSLGDLVYSLPLAPGQKKQIVVFESSHSLTGAESQSISQGESLSAELISDRFITDQISGGINENMSGRSRAHTSGMSAGLGVGVSYGGIGASLGVAGGFANSNSSASQNSSRNISQSFGEKLRQSLMQNAESYRELNASVVTTVTEGQDYGVTAETVANHNHCHSLTMMYFEVLRHYAIYQELSHVEECVFVPLLMTNFSTENIHKWKDILAKNLKPIPSNTYLRPFSFIRRQHPLLKAFDANDRIKNDYERVNFPKEDETYADTEVMQIKGRMRMNVNIPRPKTKYDRIKSFPIVTETVTTESLDVEGTVRRNIGASIAVGILGPIGSLFFGSETKEEEHDILVAGKIYDAFMTMDDNYRTVPPAKCIRIKTFSSQPVTVNGETKEVGMKEFFEDGHVDKLLWESYAKVLGYNDVADMMNYYFAGRLISEWDDIFYRDILPLVFARITDSIAIHYGTVTVEEIVTPGETRYNIQQNGEGLSLDFSTNTKYVGGHRTIQVNFNSNGPIGKTRKQIGGGTDYISMICTNPDILAIKNHIKLNIGRVDMDYTTEFFHGTLFRGYVNDDLLDGTNLYVPLTSRDKKNPRKEDEYLVNELIEHLNSNLEHYNKILWANLDPDRRYMLLDGFNIQTYTSTGNKSVMRSLASVVKNELVTITGNSLVFPVADGYRVGRNNMLEEIGDNVFEETTLFDYYKPLTPIPPYRLSVPTKGVFMEAIQGNCDACEMVKENSSQDWDKFRTEEPTQISPVITPTPTITDYKPEYKDFATPMVNIQNAPDAPAPAAGLAQMSELLGKSGVFKDITGLSGNQENAMKTYLSNQENAKAFAEMAKSLATQQHNTQNSQGIADGIAQARRDGNISEEDAQNLTRQHLQQQIDGGESARESEQFEREQNRPTLMEPASNAINRGQSVQAQRTDADGTHESIEVNAPSGGTLSPISYDVPLIPQPNKTSCWAASMAMLVSYSRSLQTSSSVVISAAELADEVGYTLEQSYGWDRLENVKDYFGFEEITLQGSQFPSPSQWRSWLENYGPLYITVVGAPSHAIIVHGIEGDMTESGTRLSILNPWDTEESFDNDPTVFNPPNEGYRDDNVLVSDLNNRMNAGNLSTLSIYENWRVLYLPGLGSPSSSVPPSGATSNTVFRLKCTNRFLSRDPEIRYTASIISAVYSQDITINDPNTHSIESIPNGTHSLIITPEHTEDEPSDWSAFAPITPGSPTPERVWLEERTSITVSEGRITAIGDNPNFTLTGNIVECRLRPLWAKTNHKTSRTAPTPSLIVLHHTAGERDLPPHFVGLENRTAAAHYVITKGDGTVASSPGSIIKLAQDEESAFHARGTHPFPNVWHGSDGINDRSIGIEIVHLNGEYKEEQYVSLIKLLTDLTNNHGILPKNIIGHMDIARNRAQDNNPGFLGNRILDPGRLFDWPRIENAGFGIKPSSESDAFSAVAAEDIYDEFYKADNSIKIPLSPSARPGNYNSVIEEIKTDLMDIGYHIESSTLNQYDSGTAATIKVFKNRFFSGSRTNADNTFYNGQIDFETAKMIKRVKHAVTT
ncbi:N-acetylmuramoyl-L-alanine amidase [Zhouia amylolytica]|uniref:N-acetylmuramoyl-L-alanine amidase n=1 Tax=Zhouia amylolytica TaxID=376730 RepID=UPI0020CC8881|nr:N-acetylmuramoyl-L-alanine amidase [Zhouia amylolytica]MCQ0110685.1 N-acetylmuramoyl-L-alanine amidase [Zhouia amylolytica]